MSSNIPSPNSLKAGDTTPLVVTLSDEKGPVNLAGAQVTFRMVSRVPRSGFTPISAPATLLQDVDDSGAILFKGQVQYAWGAGETDVVGIYGFDFAVRFADGTVRSFPNDRLVTLEIVSPA